jgi:hypothetical protein
MVVYFLYDDKPVSEESKTAEMRVKPREKLKTK